MKEIKIYKIISIVLIYALLVTSFKTTTTTLAESLSLEVNDPMVVSVKACENVISTDIDLGIENISEVTTEPNTELMHIDYENVINTDVDLDIENTSEEATEPNTEICTDYENIISVDTDVSIENTSEEIEEPNTQSKYTDYEIYELAKIVMCEAEGESQQCKEYIAQTVINRVNDSSFPDNIHDVIFEENQFTPTFDGRWEIVEPNVYCYDAVNTILNADVPLTDALYFEACIGDSWHSENLTLIVQFDNTRFYR